MREFFTWPLGGSCGPGSLIGQKKAAGAGRVKGPVRKEGRERKGKACLHLCGIFLYPRISECQTWKGLHRFSNLNPHFQVRNLPEVTQLVRHNWIIPQI